MSTRSHFSIHRLCLASANNLFRPFLYLMQSILHSFMHLNNSGYVKTIIMHLRLIIWCIKCVSGSKICKASSAQKTYEWLKFLEQPDKIRKPVEQNCKLTKTCYISSKIAGWQWYIKPEGCCETWTPRNDLYLTVHYPFETCSFFWKCDFTAWVSQVQTRCDYLRNYAL